MEKKNKTPITRVLSKRDLDEADDKKVVLEWYHTAKNMTHTHTLKKFIDHLINDYNHDYGTICHAINAAALASANCLNRSDVGGIDVRQAGTVMWEFIRGWMRYEQPMRLINYQEFLHPQFGHSHEKTITPATWEWIQLKAKELLDGSGRLPIGGTQDMSWAVRNHLKNIVHAQIVPFGYEVRDG